MNPKQICKTVDSWILKDDIPVMANLKVIRRNDPNYGLTEDEIQDRNEFIRCYLLQEFELLTMIPEQDKENKLFFGDYGVDDSAYSAFNTMDFNRQLRPFNKYDYAMKKIMERVKDLAIMNSSINLEEGRKDTYRRYEALVDHEFRSRLSGFIDRYRKILNEEKRYWMKQKIAEFNRRIMECRKIWERYAPPENWDF